MNNKPNFFIVGAPKCGTTALSHYLGQHPSVFLCSPKEPHYFADDFDGHRVIKDLASYLNLFKSAAPNHSAIGEGSVLYLHSKNAIRNIYRFDPKAKIIVMLRNPVDLVASLHQQYLHALYEDEVNFETAWGLQDSRKEGRNVPRLCRQPELLMYSEVGMLDSQVERLLSVFPKEQIKFIIFDDFVKDTSTVYSDVLDFLELANDHRSSFKKVNESQALKAGVFSFLVRNSPVILRNWMTKMRFNRYLRGIPLLADKIVKTPVKRAPLDVDFEVFLRGFFKESVEKLENLLEKDLTIWKY